MPPARRGRPPGSSSSSYSNNNNNPRAAQQTLAFGRNNKVTKPSLPAQTSRKVSKSKNDDTVTPGATAATAVPEVADVKPEAENAEVVNEEDTTLAEGREKEMAIRETKQKDIAKKRDAHEDRALKVTEAAVKRYWREREMERKAPR
ncbi:MAG: hypothetical protein Q9224_004086, partial [Gallowayella concinna]